MDPGNARAPLARAMSKLHGAEARTENWRRFLEVFEGRSRFHVRKGDWHRAMASAYRLLAA